eukprot:5104021-Prymnesium_polylepis.1
MWSAKECPGRRQTCCSGSGSWRRRAPHGDRVFRNHFLVSELPSPPAGAHATYNPARGYGSGPGAILQR